MSKIRVYAHPEQAVTEPIIFDPAICNGCNVCVNTCQADVFIPNPEKNKQPIVLFPGECWYDGSCVDACPLQGAIRLNIPLMNRVYWREKNR